MRPLISKNMQKVTSVTRDKHLVMRFSLTSDVNQGFANSTLHANLDF